MNISPVLYRDTNLYTIYNKLQHKNNNFDNNVSTSSTKLENHDNEELLGFTTIIDQKTNHGWIIKANYAKESKPNNPIIYVETNYGGKKSAFNIEINNVDPNNATNLEMFALCSYADDHGLGNKSTFGTFNTLKGFEDMSIRNNYFDKKINPQLNFSEYTNTKLDFNRACKKMLSLLYKCNDFDQYNKGIGIIELFKKYSNNIN